MMYSCAQQPPLKCAGVDPWAPFLFALPAAMGQKPTEEELFQMISEVDDNMSGSIGA